MRELILVQIRDLVKDLLYYDRKDDEKLPVGAIDQAVKSGDITIEDMVREFKRSLQEGID